MTQAERIREYYKGHPNASYKEVEEALDVKNGTVRNVVNRDIKAGLCIRSEDGGLDYSPYQVKNEALVDLLDWKNDNRREWVDMLTRAAEKETDSNTMRLLIKEANKLMKEVTR